MRTKLLMALTVATATLLLSATGQASADHHHDKHFADCAKACADCQLQCDTCFKHCLGLLTEGKKEHAKTVQTCADCAEFCKLASTLTARQSPFATTACEGCAKACDGCAAACEKFKDDKHMSDCAKSCRDCAKACREMVKHAGK